MCAWVDMSTAAVTDDASVRLAWCEASEPSVESRRDPFAALSIDRRPPSAISTLPDRPSALRTRGALNLGAWAIAVARDPPALSDDKPRRSKAGTGGNALAFAG